jgi:hypothetical protein
MFRPLALIPAILLLALLSNCDDKNPASEERRNFTWHICPEGPIDAGSFFTISFEVISGVSDSPTVKSVENCEVTSIVQSQEGKLFTAHVQAGEFGPGAVKFDLHYQESTYLDERVVGCKFEIAPRLGACCLPTGQCEELTESECDFAEGEFYGVGVQCEDEVVDCGFVPFRITGVEITEAAIANQTNSNLIVHYEGGQTFRARVDFQLRLGEECAFDSGNCGPFARNVNLNVNPLVMEGIPLCTSTGDASDLPALLKYEVIITDSNGLSTSPFPADWNCVPE